MANFTAQDVKDLRERTGCGMMDCKKALTESDGDVDKAIEFLREKGLAAAAKKAGRIAAEGLVDAYVSADAKVGAVIEVNSETDFVAKNAEFKEFVATLAKLVAEKNPADVDALLNEKYPDSDLTVADMLREKILTIGENMNIRRFERAEGTIATYIHGEGRIGVMVKQTFQMLMLQLLQEIVQCRLLLSILCIKTEIAFLLMTLKKKRASSKLRLKKILRMLQNLTISLIKCSSVRLTSSMSRIALLNRLSLRMTA